MRSWPGALVFILACELVGVLGAVTTGTGRSDWYQELAKPDFQPPGWVFGPVWTLLYALMGVAAWRVWRLGPARSGVPKAMALFGAQLALNAAWSPVFFGAHAILPALLLLLALGGTLVATLLAFRLLDRPATRMLVPYLLWVTFAAVLNASIWMLN